MSQDQIYTVYYFDGREDHNLIVRADSKETAERIIRDHYIPTLSGDTPTASPFSDDDLEGFELGATEIAEMDSTGYYLYDQGT